MSRRSKPAKRIPLADPVYNSIDISKFINRIMRRGKKSLAEKIFYATLTKIEERTNEKSLEIFQKAMTNATPLLEVKARRIGGSTYQVPIEVKADRGFALASTWLIEAAKKVGLSKKTLDEYFNQIREGKKYNFDFNKHKKDKVNVLRGYVKKMNDPKNKKLLTKSN